MGKKITPQKTNPPLDVEKFVRRMNYWIGMRTDEMVMDMWNDISMNGHEGEFEEILECLKTNNFEFNLYEEWKNYLERWSEEDEEVA